MEDMSGESDPLSKLKGFIRMFRRSKGTAEWNLVTLLRHCIIIPTVVAKMH